MQIRPDRGWIKAGLAVLVTGVLGGGVLTVHRAAGGSRPAQKVTAEGVTDKDAGSSPSGQGFDLGSVRPAGADEAPAAKADLVVGDKVPTGDGSVTVSAVEDNVSAGRLFGAGKGFKYIAAEVKGCSGPNEKNITFEPAYFLLRLDDGTIRDPGVDAKKPSLEGGTVPPGKCLSGWVTFTVPEGALPTGVIYDGSVRTAWTVPLPKNAKQTTTTTLKPGTATPTTAKSDAEAGDGTAGPDGSTTTSTKPKSTATTSKSTATTAKPTPTTARGSTATTSKSTATTGKSSGSTTTTTKSSGSTTTTTKSSGSTTTTSKASSSTTTTVKSSGSTTTTSKATTTSTAGGNS